MKKNLNWILALMAIIFYFLLNLYLGEVFQIKAITLFAAAEKSFWGLPHEQSLPFQLSRFWDIFFILALTYLIIIDKNYIEGKTNRQLSIVPAKEGPSFSLMLGLFFGLGGALVCGVVSGLMGSIFFGLIIFFLFGASNALLFSLASSLGFVLITGFPGGIIFGAINASIYAIPFVIRLKTKL